MRSLLILALAAAPWAAQAAELQDWSVFDQNLGPYSDSAASKVTLDQIDGPTKGKAIRINADLVKWGGAWANTLNMPSDLAKATGLHFMAKAAGPGTLIFGLKDSKKVQAQVAVRVKAGDWQDFNVPLSLFKRSEWQDPEAPKDAPLDLTLIQGLNLSPYANGKSQFSVGPVGILTGKVTAKTGLMQDARSDGQQLAQDFEDLEVGAYGTYVDDKGSKLDVTMQDEAGKKNNRVASFKYDIKDGGWAGAWMRVGDEWGGVNWKGAKTLSLRVNTSSPAQLTIAFNDNNQVAYVADLPATQGKGWETFSLPLSAFEVNKYYQPPQAKKGAAQDLSHLESFNIGFKSGQKGSVQIDDLLAGF